MQRTSKCSIRTIKAGVAEWVLKKQTNDQIHPLSHFSRGQFKSRTNKSLWEAPQAFHTSSSELSTQTGESLFDVQLPEEDELAEPLDIPISSTL